MKRGKRCLVQHCLAAAPFASPADPEVHACESHKGRDFVNMRNKRCLAKGCYRNPHYGVSRLIDPNSKAQYCTEHKAPGMQNVNGGRCAGENCSKQPRFSFPGEKGKFCSKHREEGMVDVLYTPCAAEGCKKHPHFGFVEGGPRYCAQHRAEGMVDVKHRRCAVKSCRKDRVQTSAGIRKRGKFCEIHSSGSSKPETSIDKAPVMDQDAASSEGAVSDRKRSRAWPREIDDDGDCMSSEGSQRGSSMEDSGSVSNDYPSGRATRPTMYGDMHGQPRTLTFAKQVSTSHCMEPAISHASLRAPFSRAPLPGSFEQRSWSTETYAPPSKTENDECHGAAEPHLYHDSAHTNPYPLYQRGHRDTAQSPYPEGGVAKAAHHPGYGRAASATSAASTPARPFRLKHWEPGSNPSNHSWYPCPWEFTREGQSARMSERSATQCPGPVAGWSGYPPPS